MPARSPSMEEIRNSKAVRMAARHYFERMKHDWKVVLPGLLLPAVGTVFAFYIPAIFVGKILAWYGHAGTLNNQVWLYVAMLSGAWLLGEAIWRVGIHFLILADRYGIQQLYINAMDYLLAKDLSFLTTILPVRLLKKLLAMAKIMKRLSTRLLLMWRRTFCH